MNTKSVKNQRLNAFFDKISFKYIVTLFRKYDLRLLILNPFRISIRIKIKSQ